LTAQLPVNTAVIAQSDLAADDEISRNGSLNQSIGGGLATRRRWIGRTISEQVAERSIRLRRLSATQQGNLIILETRYSEAEYNGSGDIADFRQVNREVLAPGTTANSLLARRSSMNFDAWDIDIFYEGRTEIESVEYQHHRSGPLRVALEIAIIASLWQFIRKSIFIAVANGWVF